MKIILFVQTVAETADESNWLDKQRPVSLPLLALRVILNVLPITYKSQPTPVTAFLTADGDVKCSYATDYELPQKLLSAQTLFLKNFYRTTLPQLGRFLMISSGVKKIAQSHICGIRGH